MKKTLFLLALVWAACLCQAQEQQKAPLQLGDFVNADEGKAGNLAGKYNDRDKLYKDGNGLPAAWVRVSFEGLSEELIKGLEWETTNTTLNVKPNYDYFAEGKELYVPGKLHDRTRTEIAENPRQAGHGDRMETQTSGGQQD